MSRIPLLRDLDSAERILVSKKIDPLRMLAEWDFLLSKIDNFDPSMPVHVGIRIPKSKQRGQSLLDQSQLVKTHDYPDIQGTVLDINAECRISPSCWENARVTYIKKGDQLGRLVQYERMDSSSHMKWSSEVFIFASGPQKGKLLKYYHVTKGDKINLPQLGADKIAVTGKGIGAYFAKSNIVAASLNERIGAEAKRQQIPEDILQFTAEIEEKLYVCYRGRARSHAAWGFLRTDFESSYREQLATDFYWEPNFPNLGTDKISITAGGVGAYFSNTTKTVRMLNDLIDAEAQRQNVKDALQFTALIVGKPYVCHRGMSYSNTLWGFLRTDFESSYCAQLTTDLSLERRLPSLGTDKIVVSSKPFRNYFTDSPGVARVLQEKINAEIQRQNIPEEVIQFTATIEGKPYVCYRGMSGIHSACAFLKTDFESSYCNNLAQDFGFERKFPPFENDKVVVSQKGLRNYFRDSGTAARILQEKIKDEAERQNFSEDTLRFTAIIQGKPYVCYRGRAGTLAWGFLKSDLESSYRDSLAEDLRLGPKLPDLGKDKISIWEASAYFERPAEVARVINQKINNEAKRQRIGEDVLQFTAEIGEKSYECFRGLSNRPVWGFKKTDFETSYRDQLTSDLNFRLKPAIDFRNQNREEVAQFIRDHEIEELIVLFGSKPYFSKTLSVLRAGSFAGTRITDFMPKVAEFETGEVLTTEGGRPTTTQEERTAYIGAVMAAYRKQELDISDRGCKQSISLFIRICRPAFENNPEQLLTELYEKAKECEEYLALDEEGKRYFSDLYFRTAEHFEKVLCRRDMIISSEIGKTEPYPYQIEAIQHLVEKERAILAYGTGLGKTKIAITAVEVIAAESAEPKTTLWITDSTNKEKIRREILKHSHLDPEREQEKIQIIISGEPQKRAKQIDQIDNALWRIVNFQQLVSLHENYREEYEKLVSGVDILVVDEAHMIGNPQSLQSKVVRKIESPYCFLLSATPCKNQIEDYYALFHFLYPDDFKSLQAFRDMYTRTVDGIQQLQADSEEFVLYRFAEETLPTFDPDNATKIPSIPKKIRLVEPEQWITYELLPESFEIIEKMLSDFRKWAREYNVTTTNGEKLRVTGAVNPLMMFSELLQASYLTKRYKITKENPIWKAVDPVVEEAIRNGEKLNLWAFHTELISGMEERFGKYGFRRLDGTITGAERQSAVDAFQNDKDVPILGASSVAGVGLDLYADRAIFLEPPPTIQRLLQTEGRNLRVIGPDNMAYARPEVHIQFVVPNYPKELLSKVTLPRVKNAMERGPLPKWIISRLQRGEKLHQWLLDGGDPKDVDLYFKASVLDAMGLVSSQQDSPL